MKSQRKRTKLAALLLALLILAGCSAAPMSGGVPSASAPLTPAEPPLYEWGANDGGAEPEDANGRYGAAEQYLPMDENPVRSVSEQNTMTVSLKVDTAAYTNVARYLEAGHLPEAAAVRTEELINYFSYDAPAEFGEEPFSVYAELGPSPFDSEKHLALLRVRTPEIAREELPPCSFTFLIDTSGSMESHDKLPLLREAFALLVETLDERDRVSIVTYAGSAGVVLDGARGDEKARILDAIDSLAAGGSTAGGAGIELAYRLAGENRLPEGNNRVILATDGDFNVGINRVSALEDYIGQKRETGIYLSVLGFGTGNLRDDIMETLASKGNGNYAYISSRAAAEKVLVEEMGSNLFTVADDVKAQVEFNPANVESWRLIGYENRLMDNRDFADDTKDAGEIGAGTDVVLLFELTLNPTGGGNYPDELFELRIRHKQPGSDESRLAVFPVEFRHFPQENSDDFRFAASVAMFGELLRGSEFGAAVDIEQVMALAEGSLGADSGGYRAGYLELLKLAQRLL